AGEVVEEAVEAIRIEAVAIADALGHGSDERDAFAHQRGETFAARGMESEMVVGFHVRDASCAASWARRSAVPTSCQSPVNTSPESRSSAAALYRSGASGALAPLFTGASSCGDITATPA